MGCGCKKTGRWNPAERSTVTTREKPESSGPKVWTGARPAAKPADTDK